MKKMLLFVVAMLTATTSFAQDNKMEDPIWMKTITDVVDDVKDVQTYAPIIITDQGDVVKTGAFTQVFSFAGTELEPIATSAYIVKYDKDGNEVWGNALRGAATVTAITFDDAGNIYVAGKFADMVIITSTDGLNAKINGMDGNIEQVSSFIVVYDSDGKLVTHREFVPWANYDLSNIGLYFPDPKDVYFEINNIKVAYEKVYVTAKYTGVNIIDQVTLVGNVLAADLSGWFMFFELRNAAALSFDKDLTGAELLADVKTTEEQVGYEMWPSDINLAVDGFDVYVAWTGHGNLSMTTAKGKSPFNFDDGTHPFVVADITNGYVKAFQAPAPDSPADFYRLDNMQVAGGKLYIAGTYIGALPFDNTKTSKGACDAFVAALKTSDLSVELAETSGLNENEQERNKYNEKVITMLTDGNEVSLLVDVIDMNTKEVARTYGFDCDTEETDFYVLQIPYHISSASISAAGVAFNSNVGTESTLRYYADLDFLLGVETIDNFNNRETTTNSHDIFNLQGQKVTKAQKGVYVQNGKKVILK